MKKIFLLFVAVCALFACDPTHEKISNDGHITIDELKAKTVVTVDKAASGANGNVISCQTLAPVNAKWSIGDKEFFANAAKKKMKLGTHEVILTALCADGTVLTSSYQVDCQEITDPLQKFYIFGSADNTEPAILGPGDAAAGRFSDGEGKYFPFLSDDVYLGKKTLIFDIIDAQDGKFIWGDDYGCTVRVMSGWWDGPFADNVPLSVGLWELPITDEIAEVCAKGKTAHDLDLMMTRGTVKIKSVYYEE
jgi:hypothetical protein